jgi:abortive infection bacteriophage resistance protein
MNKFKIEVKRQDDLAFVRHHQNKYGGQFPVWVAVELFSFGMLAQLFDMLTETYQWAISREYSLTPEEFAAFIGSAVDVRNICAHYSRLYHKKIDDKPILAAQYKPYESGFVFPTLLMLKCAAGGHAVYGRMIRDIAELERDYPEADLALCGFPRDWETVLRGA